MYAITIAETDSYLESRIARTILESMGFPTVATKVNIGGEDNFAILTSAPHNYDQTAISIAVLYALGGEAGLAKCQSVKTPESSRAIPVAQRDAIRKSMLVSLYTAGAEEHVSVTSEPPYESVIGTAPVRDVTNHDGGDEHTEPVHNPLDGGFDGECNEVPAKYRERPSADKYDNWKSGGRGADIARGPGLDW